MVLVVGGAAVMATESAGRRGPLPSRSEERGKGAERGARGRCRSANETAPRRPPRNARAANRISDEGVETPTSNSDIELFILISPTVYPDEQLVGLCTLIDSSISGRGGGPKPPPASRDKPKAGIRLNELSIRIFDPFIRITIRRPRVHGRASPRAPPVAASSPALGSRVAAGAPPERAECTTSAGITLTPPRRHKAVYRRAVYPDEHLRGGEPEPRARDASPLRRRQGGR